MSISSFSSSGFDSYALTLLHWSYLKLHEPSLLHGGLVHHRGSLRQNLESTQPSILTVFTSKTFPEAGQKASEAAFTDSTEEKESLKINRTLWYLPSLNGGSYFRELNVHNISQRVLSIVSNSNNSGLSSSVLHNITKSSVKITSIHSWSLEK